jgi:putative ATP-dependent endonuclease of the OLD family
MYLSRLIVKNYRSVEYADISFSKGMNVIIGKNNSGKSNIIRALDIVLGESIPTYKKHENILDTDFYLENVLDSNEANSNEIFIWCELVCCNAEQFDWNEIDDSDFKCFGYTGSIEIRYDKSDFIDDLRDCFDVDLNSLNYPTRGTPEENGNYKTYISDSSKLYDEFNEFDKVAYCFYAKKSENDVEKDMRMFVFKHGSWKMFFRPILRNFFIQSAIIPSFRDPIQQLKINQWSWFGKMLKKVISSCESELMEELKDSFQNVQSKAERVFGKITSMINKQDFLISFPGAKIYFQFCSDIDIDIYKGTQIYIDDGLKTSIYDKGSGIQSSVIISLFSHYCKELNSSSNSSSLLCVEEPELYLHPHACRDIRRRLEHFLDHGKNQVIISTHSPELINTVDGNSNIISLSKNTNKTEIQIAKTNEFKKFFIDNNQNEVFFSDGVILVEGFDKYIVKWIAEELWKESNESLDSKNISVLNVNGKNEFSRMVQLLNEINKKVYIIADFDYLLRDEENPDQPRKSIENLTIDFFSKKQKYHPESCIFKKIQDLRKKIKQAQSVLFYNAKRLDEFQDQGLYHETESLLIDLTDFNVLILPFEIEGLLKNDHKCDKLSLKKIYEFGNRIREDDCSIRTLFNTSLIDKFLMQIIKG